MLGGAHNKGIYLVEKDKLTICLDIRLNGEWPTKFSSENAMLFVLQRKK
jgi:hypothetical protein